MISIQGKGVSSGVGVGPLYFYHRTKTEIPRYTVTDPDAEWHRFKGAQTAAIEQLGELAEKARAEARARRFFSAFPFSGGEEREDFVAREAARDVRTFEKRVGKRF